MNAMRAAIIPGSAQAKGPVRPELLITNHVRSSLFTDTFPSLR
jgi:hypothetical protein